MAEFTGERVVPGQVEPDLWNEHRARYLFAARRSRDKRVLDVGCGTGYGVAELARFARIVVGVDVADEAVRFAQATYGGGNVAFVKAAAESLPLRDHSIDLVVCFEVIEHTESWADLLAEVHRVLTPSGQFVVSTPNKDFYAESRKRSGPNPFHKHEFDYEGFCHALSAFFPYTSLFVQNHGSSVTIQPVDGATGTDVQIEGEPPVPGESNFFIAVCASAPQTDRPAFVHVPTTANVLRERGRHIELLEQEIKTKDTWLDEAKRELLDLLEKHRSLEAELRERNRWADELNSELAEARERLNQFHVQKDAEIGEIVAGYERKVAALERESEAHARWAMEMEQKYHQAEETVKERTLWAQRLDAEVEALRAKLSMIEASRWIRLGKAIGLGPGAKQN